MFPNITGSTTVANTYLVVRKDLYDIISSLYITARFQYIEEYEDYYPYANFGVHENEDDASMCTTEDPDAPITNLTFPADIILYSNSISVIGTVDLSVSILYLEQYSAGSRITLNILSGGELMI